MHLWNGVLKTLVGLCVYFGMALTVLQAADGNRQKLLEPYGYAQLRAYEGERFRVWGGEGLGRVIELTLERSEVGQIDEKVEQFTLHFSGPEDYKLEKNAYKFEHPQSGVFRLWIEPAEAKAGQQWYRVDFNLLK